MKTCLCHSKKLFQNCCEPFLIGTKTASSPLELMQSRFSAYTGKDEAYLLRTWDSSTRPRAINMAQSPQWIGLQIIKTSSKELHGIVEFKATYMDKQELCVLHETSRFIKRAGTWFYVDGDLHGPQEVTTPKNAPCPCGSGKKFKRCCA